MSESAASAHAAMSANIGGDPVFSEWIEVTQERIDAFADATDDHQFIHVNVDRARAETPFGGTIAHGFLTLSLLPHLSTSIPSQVPKLDGVVMGINYGLNKVRFINPVPSGSRVRASAVVTDVALKGNAVDQTRTMTVEIEGQDRPAMVAEWIGRVVFA